MLVGATDERVAGFTEAFQELFFGAVILGLPFGVFTGCAVSLVGEFLKCGGEGLGQLSSKHRRVFGLPSGGDSRVVSLWKQVFDKMSSVLFVPLWR